MYIHMAQLQVMKTFSNTKAFSSKMKILYVANPNTSLQRQNFKFLTSHKCILDLTESNTTVNFTLGPDPAIDFMQVSQ